MTQGTVSSPADTAHKTTHDALNRVIRRTKIVPGGYDQITEYTLDPAGNILAETQTTSPNAEAGNLQPSNLQLTTTHTYDTANRRLSSTSPGRGTSSIAYDDANRITTQTNPDGSEIITVRYLDGRTKLVTGSGTVSQSYTYGVNPDGSQWTRVASGPNGEVWQKSTSNMLGQSIEQRQPGFGNTELVSTMTYNAKGQLIESTPPAGASTRYEYNDLGEQIASYLDVNNNDARDDAGPDRITESETAYVLDGADWWMESKSYLYDHNQNTPTLTGTSRQRLTGLGTPHPADPAHGILVAESQSIDIHGNLSSTRRYQNRVTRSTWTEQQSPFSDHPATSRSVNGLLLESYSPTPNSALRTPHSYDYDALQRRLGTTDPRTGRSFVTYDPTTGLVTASTDAAGNVTTFTYDTTGRQISVTDPLGNTTHTAYTEDGQVRAQWGATYPVVYEYDDLDRMVKLHTLRDPNVTFNPTPEANGVLPLASISQLLTSVDTTQWLYDPATGLLLQKLHADGQGPTYTYTPDGRLLTRTHARQSLGDGGWAPLVTTYTYDVNTLELTNIHYSDNTPAVSNEFDRLGRLVTTTDAFGLKTYSYNNTLQPSSEVWDGLVSETLTRQYHPDGRPNGLTLSTGYQVEYAYNAATGYFDGLTYTNTVNNVSHSATYTYLADSAMINGYTLGDLKRTVTYEPNRNLVDAVTNTWNAATTISAFDYTNDAAGRRTNREDSGSAFASTLTNNFGYNSKSEVTSADMRNGASTYTFDQIGNRVTAAVPAAIASPGGTFNYTTNALNQYTAINGPAAPPPPLTPLHDPDGNLVDDGKGTTFEWNAENRMVKVVKGDLTIENTYDGQGRRVRKQVFDGGTPVEDSRYFYDGWNVIYEDDILSNTDTKYYVWGLDLSQSLQGAGGVGGLLLVKQGTSTWAPTFDANGNISEYIDLATGNVTAHLEYDAFGRKIVNTGTAPSTYGFSTKYEDVETGYLYFGFRFYDPVTGRWPNRDPIGEDGGLNLYGFAGNDGLNKYDFLGMEWEIKRSSEYPWAAAIPRDDGDTFETLAQKINLNYDERTKWLKKGQGFVSDSDEAVKDCYYGVPNVLGMYSSKPSRIDHGLAVVNNFRRLLEVLSRGFESDGFKVVFHERASNKQQFKDLWTMEGIYGIFYAGHGGLSGLYVDPDDEEFTFPNEVSPPYKLAIGAFYACTSDDEFEGLGRWRDHVAIDAGGMYRGYPGNAYWWSNGVVINPIGE